MKRPYRTRSGFVLTRHFVPGFYEASPWDAAIQHHPSRHPPLRGFDSRRCQFGMSGGNPPMWPKHHGGSGFPSSILE
jgi:hypothetical protein